MDEKRPFIIGIGVAFWAFIAIECAGAAYGWIVGFGTSPDPHFSGMAGAILGVFAALYVAIPLSPIIGGIAALIAFK